MSAQHMTALAQANRIRRDRAKIKAELKQLPRQEAMAMLADLLENPPGCCVNAQPLELLLCVRYTGRYVALSWLRKAGVSESRRCGELTERQRSALAGVLRSSTAERVAA